MTREMTSGGFLGRGIDWKHYFERLEGSQAQKLRIFRFFRHKNVTSIGKVKIWALDCQNSNTL